MKMEPRVSHWLPCRWVGWLKLWRNKQARLSEGAGVGAGDQHHGQEVAPPVPCAIAAPAPPGYTRNMAGTEDTGGSSESRAEETGQWMPGGGQSSGLLASPVPPPTSTLLY